MEKKKRQRNRRSKAKKASSSTYDDDVVDGMMIMGRFCNIPEEIIVDIVSRLPTKSVLQCRQVCKAWRDLLSHPYFAQIHFRRLISSSEEEVLDDDGKFGFVYFDTTSSILSYVEYDDIFDKTLITKMNPTPNMIPELIGSSYGLICMSLGDDSSLYICNPITDEYTLLPKRVPSYYRRTPYFKGRMAVGFGYHPSINQYKAVRICCCSDQHPYPSRVEVYTLGAGNGWRDIGEFNFYSFYLKCGFTLPGKLANGVIHWLCKKGKILSFDLADEEFRLLSLPSCFSSVVYSTIELLVLGGGLCVRRSNRNAKSVEIWSLKKSGEWEIMFSVAHPGITVDKFVPLALIKRGEVLSSYNGMCLCRYDPKTGTIQDFVEFGKCPSSLARHMHTFVSLKGLGEEVM